MSRFEELYKGKKTTVLGDASFPLEQLDLLRKKDEEGGIIPEKQNPIALLSEEQYQKLRWAVTKDNSLTFMIYADSKDPEKKQLKMFNYGEEFYCTETPEKNHTQKQFSRYVEHAYDIAFAKEMDSYCSVPTKFFQNNNYAEPLFLDLRDAGADYANKLDENNFARYGFSSDNYRAMEDVMSEFNNKLSSLEPRDLKNPKVLSDMRKQLNVVVNTIKQYIDDKGGLTVVGGTEYEKKRIRAAKDAYFKFAKLDKIVSAACLAQASKTRYEERIDDIKSRFNRIEKNVPDLKKYVNEAREGATKIADVYKGYPHELNDEEKRELIASFDKMCELQFRRRLIMHEDERIYALAFSASSEDIMRIVKESSEYKIRVGNPSKINAETAKEILENKSEFNATDNYRNLISEKLGIDYKPQMPTGPMN